MILLPPYKVRWQPAATPPGTTAVPPFDTHYPVPLNDGSCLELPLRALPGGAQAIALLMSNQTPFAVENALGPMVTQLAAQFQPETIVGIPTMGLDYARLAARGLNCPHYVAMGLSRKFWYDDELSEHVVSSTSPDQTKTVYLDPALLSRVAGQRVVLVDDVINTGSTSAAALRLLLRAGAQVEGVVAVLTEGRAWQQALGAIGPQWPGRVKALGHIPMFEPAPGGRWQPIPDTL